MGSFSHEKLVKRFSYEKRSFLFNFSHEKSKMIQIAAPNGPDIGRRRTQPESLRTPFKYWVFHRSPEIAYVYPNCPVNGQM
jgi:hypothetical protein